MPTDTSIPPRPTTEQGTPFNTARVIRGLPAAFGARASMELIEDNEYNADLKFPQSRDVYDQMRTDSQIHGLWLGCTLPIRRYQWMIDPASARDEVVEKLAFDLNLPILGKDDPTDRRRARFNHDDHLYHALLALVYGFMFMEQYGRIEDGLWRMRKLAPRMPHSVEAILADPRDGGLIGIRQVGDQVPLDVNRLVAYVWQKEGANWYGRSMLRPLYKNWFYKDQLQRVDLLKHKRNGMGVPVARQTEEGTSPQAMQQAAITAARWRAGETASTALPYGVDIELKGVTGSLPDTLASIRYHDEAMARALLMMFIMLGSTSSGGLNGTGMTEQFVDFFQQAQESIADWYVGVTNEHVIEDWVDWNYGIDENAPRIVYKNDRAPGYSVGDLVSLINRGVVTVDDELEQFIREQGHLPKASEDTLRVNDRGGPEEDPLSDPAQDLVQSSRRRSTCRTQSTTIKTATDAQIDAIELPDRKLRRQPYEHEITAQTQFAAIDDSWEAALDALLSGWTGVREDQVDELAGLIASAKNLKDLSKIKATVQGADIITESLLQIVIDGVESAMTEAKLQGVTVVEPDTDEIIEDLEDRAEAIAEILTTSISEAASRKALSLTGGELTPEEVADEVKSYLNDLSNQYLEDQFGGALTTAQNTGRAAVMEANDAQNIYASELLDTNTCPTCLENDGKEYDSIASARKDYPTGGFKNCKGGPRCRGALVAVYDEEGGS